MAIYGAEPVPGAVCSTRRSLPPNKQRTPRAAQQYSWIPDQHSCAWEQAVCARSMPLAHTAGWGSVVYAPATNSSWSYTVLSPCPAPCAPRAAVRLPTNNAPHMLYSSAVGFTTNTAVHGSKLCVPGACPQRTQLVGAQSDLPQQLIPHGHTLC